MQAVLNEPVELAPIHPVNCMTILPLNLITSLPVIQPPTVQLPGISDPTTYLEKSRRIVIKVSKNSRFQQKLYDLNHLTSEAKSQNGELLLPPAIPVPEKRKEVLKAWARQRRAAIDGPVGLMRTLTEIGLSYRKLSHRQPKPFTISPLSSKTATLKEKFVRCEGLFFGGVAKMAVFKKQLETPFKILKPDILSKMKGYVEHLHHLIINQCGAVHDLSVPVEETGRFLDAADVLVNCGDDAVSGKTMKSVAGEMLRLLNDITVVVDKYSAVVNAIPSEAKDVRNTETLNVIFGQDANLYRETEKWRETVSLLRNVKNLVETHRRTLVEFAGDAGSSELVVGPWFSKQLLPIRSDLTELGKSLMEVRVLLPGNIGVALDNLAHRISSICVEFDEKISLTNENGDMITLEKSYESMLIQLLKGLQTVHQNLDENDEETKLLGVLMESAVKDTVALNLSKV